MGDLYFVTQHDSFNIDIPCREFSEVASHCFLHCDLVGQNFLCYMLSRIGKLQMLRLDGLKAVHKNGLVASIPARDAVALQVLSNLYRRATEEPIIPQIVLYVIDCTSK